MFTFDISIRTKLILAFAGVLLFVLAVGAAGWSGISSLSRSITEIGRNSLPSVKTAGSLRAGVIDVRVSIVNHILYTEVARMAVEEDVLTKKTAVVAKLTTAYETLISLPGEKELFQTFQANWKASLDAVPAVIAHSRNGDKVTALAETTAVIRPRIKAAAEALDALVALNDAAADAVVADSERAVGLAHTVMVAIVSAAALLTFLVTVLIVLSISRGIGSILQPIQILASGDAEVTISHRGARTEIGAIADAVQVFKDNLIRSRKLEEETVQARLAAEEQRKAGMRQMADSFEAAVGGIIGMVSSSATELQATAQTMTATATETASQSTTVAAAAEEAASNVNTVAAAAEEAASNVNTVAAAAEELGSSVQEIGRQVGGSADLARMALSEAEQTASLVQTLSAAAAEIGNVVALISSIAGQTNLLALNATIEAARAGEAARGFAVVASGVKELASQTARATDEISTQIARIQGSTGQAVTAIDAITGRIREISGVTTSLSAAVEEQGAATQEIVRNVSQAAMGTGEVTSNITGVARAAEETGAAASQVLSAASELSRQSEHLNAEVTRFLATVRAA